MSEVGIRELKQNASAVVARAARGDVVTVTDRGRPVAVLSPIGESRLETLLRAGRARPPRSTARLSDLPAPPHREGTCLSAALAADRDDERY